MSINLSLWRELEAKNKRRRFMIRLTTSLLITLLTWATLHSYQLHLLHIDHFELNDLQNNSKKLDPAYQHYHQQQQQENNQQAQLQFLIKRINQSAMLIKALNAISQSIPDTVYLTKVSSSENSLNLIGEASSHADIATFLEQLEAAIPHAQPKVSETMTGHENNPNTANVSFRIVYELPFFT